MSSSQYYSPEQRKEYNKIYYEKNKDKIISKILTKVTCPHCNRKVNHQNLYKHSLTSICRNYSQLINRVQLDNKQLEILKNEIKIELSSKI
jgi:hypothetical protein